MVWRTRCSMRGPAVARTGAPRPRVVYLAGLGRSGTTLLERLLGELPGVCPAGEVAHMWLRGVVAGERCGCGRPFHECAFWQGVGQAAFGGWGNADVERVLRLRRKVDRTRFLPLLAAPARPPAFGRLLAEYLSFYRRLYAAIEQTTGCRLITDSSKHPSLAFCLRWCDGLDLRVIHVVRDSRAVAHSWTKHVPRPDAADSYMRTYSPAAAATRWNAQNSALHLLAAIGTPTLRVRYEDLVAHPAAALAAITRFAGLLESPAPPPFLGGDGATTWAELGVAHTASGNPMRFATGRLPIRRDESWRTDMPASQRRAVTALTLPLLAHYGYPRVPR